MGHCLGVNSASVHSIKIRRTEAARVANVLRSLVMKRDMKWLLDRRER